MNENNKENGYKIIQNSSNQIEISNNYPVIPLINTKTIKLQDLNYKDLLYTDTLGVTFPNVNWPTGVVTVLAITGTIMTLSLSTPVVLIGTGFLLASTVIPLFWKKDEVTSQTVWDSLIPYAEELLDRKISKNNKILADSELNGLEESLEEYRLAVENFLKKPKDLNAKNILIDRFSFAHNIFINRMAVFNPDGDEALLLSVYAQAANIHLLILRDAMIYAEDWGLDKDYYHEELLKYTEEYIEHCIYWSNKSLKELFEKLCNKQNKKITKAENWKKYNDYKNYITVTVFDVISLFSSYDINKYPADKKNPQLPLIELTREIYTNPIGYKNQKLNDDNMNLDLEYRFTRSPHLFSWLNNIEFLSHKDKNYPEQSYLVGNKNSYYYTNDESLNHTSIYTNPNIKPSDKELELKNTIELKDRCVYRMYCSYHFDNNTVHINKIKRCYVYKDKDNATIYFANGGVTSIKPKISLLNLALENEDSFVPINELNNFNQNPTVNTLISFRNHSHQLSHMVTYPIDRNLITSVFAWTHRDVDPKNTIKADRITQIPAVKAYSIVDTEPHGEVIKGPGHTGGDLVKLHSWSSIIFRFNFEDKNQLYKIRLRYATTKDTEIQIQLGSNEHSPDYTSTLAKTKLTDEKDLQYKVFDHQMVFENPEKLTFSELRITPYVNDVIIDKIEFIPIKS